MVKEKITMKNENACNQTIMKLPNKTCKRKLKRFSEGTYYYKPLYQKRKPEGQ
jgi:hypothetical protein